MNVPTITMDPELAKAKLKAFRANKHKDAESLYAETATAYAALAEGTPILNLSLAIQAGGFFSDMRPKVAIARADRREVCFRWRADSETGAFDCSAGRDGFGREPGLFRSADLGQLHNQWATDSRGVKQYLKLVEGYTMVPMVPADVRPEKGQLREWWILFEVDKWFDRPHGMKAPVDPLLLKHLGGELYAVLAQWDLTDVERMILEGVNRR